MANITRTDPFQYLAHFDPLRDLDNPPSWGRLRRFFTEMAPEPSIRIEVAEGEKAYTVKADIPGAKKEDIAVEVDGDKVSITAEVRREKEEKKDGEVVHSERYYGRQARSFTLGSEVDRAKVVAKYADGVLELTLPKNGARATEKIAIQ